MAAVVRRSSDRDELRAAMKSYHRIKLVSVASSGDSIRSGAVAAQVVVLDPFTSDAETMYRFLAERAPRTRVIVLVQSLRSIDTLSVPPELVAIQAFGESFESAVVRFLGEGPGSDSAPSTASGKGTETAKPDTARPDTARPDTAKPGIGRRTRLPQDRGKQKLPPKASDETRMLPGGHAKVARSSRSSSQARSIVVLGASTGGPDAVRVVLGGLPASFPLPILIVQHMPALFTEQFAASLNESVSLKVGEAEDGTQPRAGEVWVAPGGFHMEIADLSGRLSMSEGPKLHGCRPAVDVLFKSAAATYGPQVLAVVLTGMGRDGADGCQEIADAGGHVIVQDEATSTVWGMPGSVVTGGCADQIVPIKQVAFTIVGNVAAGSAQRANGLGSRLGTPGTETRQ